MFRFAPRQGNRGLVRKGCSFPFAPRPCTPASFLVQGEAHEIIATAIAWMLPWREPNSDMKKAVEVPVQQPSFSV